MIRQRAPVKDGRRNNRRAGFACAVLLTSTLVAACGPESIGPQDSGIPRKDTGISRDSGVEPFSCSAVQKQEMSCTQPVTKELVQNEIMSVGDVFVRLNDVYRDEFGLVKVDISILNDQCVEIYDGKAYAGFVKRVEHPNGVRLSIAAMTGSPEDKKAHMQVQDLDCERSCSTSEEVTMPLGELESSPLNTNLGLLSVNFDKLDENTMISLSVTDSSGTHGWSMYLAEGNAETADFWNTIIEITPWNVDTRSKRALFQITVSDCISD